MSSQTHQTSPSPTSSIYQQPPLLTRLLLVLKLTLISIIAPLNMRYLQYIRPQPSPTLTKTYPSQPTLTHRIFYPPNHKAGDSPPLILTIHGGGFFLFTPAVDDGVNATMAKELGCVVIGLDYSKSPRVKFPSAVDELVEATSQILEDESLVFDRTRVVVGGYSAGGNLCLSIAQSSRLQRRIHAILSYYPIVDFLTPVCEKVHTRPYDSSGDKDMTLAIMDPLIHGYLSLGQDLRDPRLSVYLADRESLPKDIMIVGAEYDILCHEAWLAARRFAGGQGGDAVNEKGRENTPIIASSDTKLKPRSLENNHVMFYMAKGAKHGFTHWFGEKDKAEEKRLRQVDDCNGAVYKWLRDGPLETKE